MKVKDKDEKPVKGKEAEVETADDEDVDVKKVDTPKEKSQVFGKKEPEGSGAPTDTTQQWQVQRFGDVKYSPRATFLSYFLKAMADEQIEVPVELESTMVFFDFEKEIKKIEGAQNLTSETLNAMANALASLSSKSDDRVGEAMDILIDRGFKKDDEQLKKVIETLNNRIEDNLAFKALPNLIVADILEQNKLYSALSMEDLPTIKDIGKTVSVVQKLYGEFALSRPVNKVAGFISNDVFTAPGMAFIRAMYKIFHQSASPTVPTSMTRVIEEVTSHLLDTPIVAYDEKKDIAGVRRHIKDVSVMKEDMEYGDFLAGYFQCIRIIMGFGSVDDSSGRIKIQEIASHLHTGVREVLPFLPAEVGSADINKTNDLFSVMFMVFATMRIARGDFGQTANRINAIKKVKKYDRDDSFDNLIEEGIKLSSVAYDSFLDVSAFFRHFAFSKDIHYPNVHPVLRDHVLDFVNKMTDQFKMSFTRTEHPNFLSNMSHVINAEFNFSQITVGFVPHRAMFVDHTNYRLADAETGTVTSVAARRLEKGTLFDLGFGRIDRIAFGAAEADNMKILYSYFAPRHSFFEEFDVFKALHFYKTNDLLMKSATNYADISKWLESISEIRLVDNIQSFAREFELPLEIARKIYKPLKNDRPQMMSRIWPKQGTLVTWDEATAPIYEVKLLSESRHITPVISRYPFALTRDVHLVQIEEENRKVVRAVANPKSASDKTEVVDLNTDDSVSTFNVDDDE